MVTITPETMGQPTLELESAGRLGRRGPEVFYSAVTAGDPETSEAYGIIAGCGATAEDYFNLQLALAEHGVSSIAVNPLYVFSRKHVNQIQAKAVEKALHVAKEEHGIAPRNLAGHSWGGGKMASLFNFGIEGIDMGVAINSAGFQAPQLDRIVRYGRTELGEVVPQAQGRSQLNPYQRAVLFMQHMPVASRYHKAPEHFENARERGGLFLSALWAEYDFFFDITEHPVFHRNEVMNGAVHTEPQVRPLRVAKKLVEQFAHRDAFLADQAKKAA